MSNFIKNFDLPKTFTIIFFVIILFSIFVRFQGLEYSNFQGDEVNPMDFLYEMDDGVWNYLMEQKRGPMQYVVNMINVAIFGYHNEFQIRLPFFIVGSLALLTVYFLGRKIYDNTSALIAVILMAVNGLFIAFARITQYQSVMYFLIPIGVLIFIRALHNRSNKTLIASGLLIALALLAHYDTLSVVPFFIVGLVGYYFRKLNIEDENLNPFTIFKDKENLKLLKELLLKALIFFAFALTPALMYYIPFYTHSAFDAGTSGYLENRLFGGGFMPRTEITLKLLRMYVPRFHLYFIFTAGAIGLLFYTLKVGSIKISKLKFNEKFMKYAYIFFVFLMYFASIFSLYPIKPRSSSLLVIGSSIAIATIITFSRKLKWEHAALATWFLGAYSFYFFIMKDPRTHVYVSMLPLFMLSGYGIYTLVSSFKTKVVKSIILTLFTLSLLFVSGVNWVIFVDKSPEYPWWDKDFMGWPIYRIERVRHKKIEGVFGFNNYRAWDKISELYKDGCLTGSFNSNEKDSISYFYVQTHQKQGGEWGLETDADTLVIVEGPHSWEYYDPKNLPDDYKLIATIKSKGVPVTYIYGKGSAYPDGKLLCE